MLPSGSVCVSVCLCLCVCVGIEYLWCRVAYTSVFVGGGALMSIVL